MRFLAGLFFKYRDMFAVAMFLAGFPLIYYIRDGLGVAPKSAIFTVILGLGPLATTLLFKNFKSFESPNKIGYFLTLWFLILTFLYLIFRDPHTGVKASYEYFSYTIIFFIYFALIFIDNESLNRCFLPTAIILAFIGAIALMIYIYRDPTYLIGQRASIKFGEGEDAGGNPHIFGKGAFYGLILSVLALKYNKKVKFGLLIPMAMMFIFLAVLFLTQTVAGILSAFLFFGFYFMFNFRIKSAYTTLLSLLKKWYVIVVIIAAIVKGGLAYKENSNLLLPATSYIQNRLDRIINSFFTPADKVSKNKKSIDESASNRVQLLGDVAERVDENLKEGKIRYIIFGNGYKNLYIDVPHIEVFDSFGLLMFFFYTYIFYYMIKISFKEMIKPDSPATEFIAYAFIYFIIANFTGGVIIDYTRWGFYALIVKFIKKT
jgi:MFS family permease